VEAGAGENWHDFVAWTIAQGWGGLENLAMIPGTVGAAPVQNIGAYGLELQDRFDSLDAIDLQTGQTVTLDAARCGFGYRDSVFKHGSAGGFGLKDRVLITQVRFLLPRPWKPVLGYADLERKMAEQGVSSPAPADLRMGMRHPAQPSCPTRRCWATPAAFSRTRPCRPSSAPTSSSASRASCITTWTTAA
jgi:UDP-N-acetylenolpyruvoylglucosamine reductase